MHLHTRADSHGNSNNIKVVPRYSGAKCLTLITLIEEHIERGLHLDAQWHLGSFMTQPPEYNGKH